MPLISIETNQALDNPSSLKEISQTVATMLGKPESYLMLKAKHNEHMLFAGSDKPLAHIKIKSLGLPEDKTKEFSAQICKMMHQYFSVTPERIYIEFANPERHMWGWNGATFG